MALYIFLSYNGNVSVPVLMLCFFFPNVMQDLSCEKYALLLMFASFFIYSKRNKKKNSYKKMKFKFSFPPTTLFYLLNMEHRSMAERVCSCVR